MTKDSIDQDLLPVFLEEGKDLLAIIGDGLMRFKDAPDNLQLLSVLRGPIHTIKGSARMTGAMQFGQHWHALEGLIAALLKNEADAHVQVDTLLAYYDRALLMFDALKHPDRFDVPDHVLPLESGHNQLKSAEKKSKKSEEAIAHIRIRANLLDHFLNQAGEISIAGSHVENGVEHLQKITHDLAGNIERIEKHLREAEIQADVHLKFLYRKEMAHTYFDALELDRVTQLQELTRMMSESLGDVASLQKTLGQVVGRVRESAAKRSRLTRNLQQELMAARMVKFKSVNERLQRLIRQVSREVDKEVTLDVLGANQEIDRSVLEKITVVLEHLLRNAIAHGIEHRLARLEAGKSAYGNLFLEVRTEGNELLIRVGDDGKGMNLQRIRDKAISYGLLSEDQNITTENLFELISHPGLSTSDEVTTVSGRGVGLDVVRTEVAALGGRVEVDTRERQGTLFAIYLPLTLAVTQVVLVRLGENTYAIPSLYVEHVMLTKDAAGCNMVDRGTYAWKESEIPVVSLARVLKINSDTNNGSAAVMLKNGKQFIVVLVDAVLGNKEVVTKNMGVQLARVNGLLGATILGTGEIVLILHPARLMQRKDVVAIVPAGDLLSIHEPKVTVMVVDDSLTVRRVLQKLLLREGYAVMLAKDGMDALLQLQKMVPDIMLIDIEMPRMDGFHLLEKVRERPDMLLTPVVVITSRTAKKRQDKAQALGASAYLGKPYQEEQLLTLMTTLIRVRNDR